MKRITAWAFNQLFDRIVMARAPDFVIGVDSDGGPYLNRWFLTRWRKWQHHRGRITQTNPTRWNRFMERAARLLPNLYLHEFLRDDDDRALHDHPSFGVSLMLKGSYVEHTIAPGGIHRRRQIEAGSIRYLPTKHTHRIELLRNDDGTNRRCWTLFLFGPVIREWGFHCPERGWVHWKEFTDPTNSGKIGKGCGP